jgi:hypothetical protein
MAHDVFISHSSDDKTISDAVCATLEGRGIRCWVAPRDILAGANWGESIVDAITDSRVMVLILSSNSNISQQVMREVERAVNKGTVIIPLRVEDIPLSKSLEYFLSTAHWLDAYSGPLSKHLEVLADRIEQLISDAPVPDRELMTPAPAPRSSKRRWVWGGISAATLAMLVLVVGLIMPSRQGPDEDNAENNAENQETPVATANDARNAESPQEKKKVAVAEPTDSTTPAKAFFGITYEPLSQVVADALGAGGGGLGISWILPGGPADLAGIKAGDVLTSFNGQPIRNVNDWRNLKILDLSLDEPYPVAVLRD